jgi:hypothetical protein
MIRNSLACAIVLWLAAVMCVPGHAAGPDGRYRLEPEYTVKSPDGVATVEQYAFTDIDGRITWQFWVRRGNTLTELAPEQLFHAADFHFTRNGQWVARVQKTGTGSASLYLYRWTSKGYVAATKQPLGELAWAYFKRHPDAKKIPDPGVHLRAELDDGTEENYHALGVDWPDSRYLVISLSGEAANNAKQGQLRVMRGWRCRYDLRTGKFDVPGDLTEENEKAVAPERE